ncbi:MAG TPA: protein kinase [Labilithrix sp.]|nr:protein kinase [Labilithrix sp.]
MDPSLPVLVTRLADRSALTRLLRAALRHEIAQVELSEIPRSGPHTLDLRLAGSPAVSVLAEPAGAPQNGHFPLRLRPLHRAQAAELYALLEENPSSSQARPAEAAPLPSSRPPDTVAEPRTLGFEDSGPILRAMSGSAPPPQLALGHLRRPTPIDPRVTARLDLGSGPAAAPVDDPKRTVPSAAWANGGVDPKRRAWDESAGLAAPASALPDDPRRTARSPSWEAQAAAAASAPPPSEPEGAHADDPSLSVSVVFEPDMLPSAVAAATAAALAEARREAEQAEGAGGADDDDGPSLSVSVIFEPDALRGRGRGPESSAPLTPTLTNDNDPVVSGGEITEIELDELEGELEGELEAPEAPAPDPGGDFFFDDALANLAMVPPGADGEEPSLTRASEAPATEHQDHTLPLPPDDDDDFDTLIRLPPSQAQEPAARPAMVPAAGTRAQDDARTATGGGRKKKTTRRGKDRKPRSTRHPADGEASTGEVQPSASSRRARPLLAEVEPREATDGDPLIGRRIADGKYAIESAIGSGAAGAVYKATHRELRRTVALKVLHPHYQQDPHFMKSFRGEALAASQLDHPNVMRVLDFGQEPDGLVYIVMEFLSGRTLQSLLDEERRLQTDRAVEIMIQVCAALSVAHDNGIIHRDIKPDNIMLVPSRNDEGGTFELVKVCDFGIAALQNPTREDADLVGLADNIIAGTPEYMSPEQARGSEIDARSDVYAAGICLYELVTGRPPFLGENAAEILVKQLDEEPRPPSQLIRGLDPIVEEIILRAIHKEPAKRQQSARELRVELKEIIDPADAGGADDHDERSIVENVPVLDDPASGFPGFFIALSSAVLRFGRFERGHPEASQAMKELLKATRLALRGRRELTFARRDSAKAIGFCVLAGYGEIVDLRRLLGSQLFGSFGYPFIEAVAKKGIAAITLREGIPDTELQYTIEMLLGPHVNEELRKELLGKPLRSVSVLFGADVVGRDRKLSWKVGLCAARLARDLRALSNVRGISLKKMREIREDLVTGIAHLLTKGDEVRQFLFNGDLVDEAVSSLRGFSGFHVVPLIVERLLHEPCVEAAMLLVDDFDKGELEREVVKGYLRAFATRLLNERSPKSDATVAELYRRSIVVDAEVPRDLQEAIRAQSLAEALIRDPSQFLRTLDFIHDPNDYGRELATLEAAMAVLARRAEAGALLAAIGVLARHAKGAGKPGPRESHALRTMKSMIDKQRLLPIANALLGGPVHQHEAARQLLVLAGSAGAHALYMAREALQDPAGRPLFVRTLRETGPAGWSLLSAMLPRMEVHNDTDIALVEDLLRAMPDRLDAALGDAVAKFLAHPRLRPAALAAIVPLWGDRARKPLMDALEFAEEPARIVAVAELRRLRAIDDATVNVIERLLTMKGSASEELRVAAAAALADVGQAHRVRAVALLTKGVEGKRGLVAMLRGDGATDESAVVVESMARALLALDRVEGQRAVKARLSKADASLRARLAALLQMA